MGRIGPTVIQYKEFFFDSICYKSVLGRSVYFNSADCFHRSVSFDKSVSFETHTVDIQKFWTDGSGATNNHFTSCRCSR